MHLKQKDVVILKKAKKMNYKNILNFIFLVNKEEFENELTNFFNLNLYYDVVFLRTI